MNEKQIEKHDKFIHKRRDCICVVLYLSATGGVGYRIKFTRQERYSERENFLKNWTPLRDEPDGELNEQS